MQHRVCRTVDRLENMGETLYIQGLEARDRIKRANELATGEMGGKEPLPHEGKKISEMTIDEAAERFSKMTPEEKEQALFGDEK